MTEENRNSGLTTVLTYEDDVLGKIAGNTVRDVDGVLSLEGNILDSVPIVLAMKPTPQRALKLIWITMKKKLN